MSKHPGCRTPEEVAEQAAAAPDLTALDSAVVDCCACPRLVQWRTEVALTKRAAYRDDDYWGRPVTGFGAPDARIAMLSLAPAAHGGNRTGRVFTGDPSGDFLFPAMYRVGLANQPTSVWRDDGLILPETRIVPRVRCVPPENKPTPQERDTCAPWLHREFTLLRPTLRVVVAMGAFAWGAWWPILDAVYGYVPPPPRPAFAHGARWNPPPGSGLPILLGCYHVSPHNTYTRRLTPAMIDQVLLTARELADQAE